ncbi:restriction endonuclease [Mycolicibacterium neworleansense]|uniref:Restriction endonuclease n=1 Tax=Mycolicibacterium neworleansense TaxID=146018 RepID=A0A0H5RPI0_9MYCO|nr:restriction endonuclease [Mycolicibacterium neworleansense]MCV7364922.1 restriction endonuclease [Mycolicibacterium neworleansense]CRZ15721.1 restriction endonuclease [Mycolicibacterium neworleansense]
MRRLRIKLFIAVGAAAGLASYLAGADAAWSLAVGILVPLALAATPRFLVGAFHGASTPGTREQAATEMTGLEFEDHVARVARTCGLPVIMTPLTGDWGVDLIVGHRPNRIAVQCKRLSRPVGAGAVQEVVAGAPMQDCAKTMVVTNNEFTPAARKLAELHGCELVGGAELPRLKSILRRAASTEPVCDPSADTTP